MKNFDIKLENFRKSRNFEKTRLKNFRKKIGILKKRLNLLEQIKNFEKNEKF